MTMQTRNRAHEMAERETRVAQGGGGLSELVHTMDRLVAAGDAIIDSSLSTDSRQYLRDFEQEVGQ
jgi:hypothetical protein